MPGPIDVEGFNTWDKSISLGSDEDMDDIEPLTLSDVVQAKCKQWLSKPDCHHEGKWSSPECDPECVEEKSRFYPGKLAPQGQVFPFSFPSEA